MTDGSQGSLFGGDPGLQWLALPAKAPAPGVALVLMPNRSQVELRSVGHQHPGNSHRQRLRQFRYRRGLLIE